MSRHAATACYDMKRPCLRRTDPPESCAETQLHTCRVLERLTGLPAAHSRYRYLKPSFLFCAKSRIASPSRLSRVSCDLAVATHRI